MFQEFGTFLRKLYRFQIYADDFGNFLNQRKIIWDFNNAKTLNNWMFTCDDELGGKSWCKLEQSQTGRAIFHGNISTYKPLGTGLLYSGYAAIQSKPAKSGYFFWKPYHDVSIFDAFSIRLRGDGRKYVANVQIDGTIQDDVWQSFIYTRGGPLWETIILPFSDFLHTFRGYLQDHPFYFSTQKLKTFGLILADRVNGDFHLEIDSISVVQMQNPPDHGWDPESKQFNLDIFLPKSKEKKQISD